MSTRDAAKGSGAVAGRRAGKRSRRGAPLVEEKAEEEQEQEEEEDGADKEEEDLGVPAVWQRGPSRLPDRPIPLEHRPVLRPDGKR